MEDCIRKTVCFSGRVQGVGFRYTACSLAREFDVTGRVRNLADGRVELLAEGSPAELDRFLDSVRRTLAAYIRNEQITDSPALNQWPNFDVNYQNITNRAAGFSLRGPTNATNASNKSTQLNSGPRAGPRILAHPPPSKTPQLIAILPNQNRINRINRNRENETATKKDPLKRAPQIQTKMIPPQTQHPQTKPKQRSRPTCVSSFCRNASSVPSP